MTSVHVTAISDTRNDFDFNAKVYRQLEGADTVRCRVRHVFDLVDEVLEAAGTRALAGLDIVGHARAGMMRLGSPRHGFETVLSAFSPSLSAMRRLGDALTEEAVVRLIGCNVGRVDPGGDSGPVLQLALSHLLGCPVAATVHPVFPRDFSRAGFQPDGGTSIDEILAFIDHRALADPRVAPTERALVRKASSPPVAVSKRLGWIELWREPDLYARGWSRLMLDRDDGPALEKLARAIHPDPHQADLLAEPDCYFALRWDDTREVVRGRICLGWRAMVVTPGDPHVHGQDDTLFALDAAFLETIAGVIAPSAKKREVP